MLFLLEISKVCDLKLENAWIHETIDLKAFLLQFQLTKMNKNYPICTSSIFFHREITTLNREFVSVLLKYFFFSFQHALFPMHSNSLCSMACRKYRLLVNQYSRTTLEFNLQTGIARVLIWHCTPKWTRNFRWID